MKIELNHDLLKLEDMQQVICKGDEAEFVLGAEAKSAIQHCRQYLESKLSESDRAFYGINTGFGYLCNSIIQKEDLNELQANLIRSHAVGTGDPVPDEIVRLMLFLKARNLAYGHSAVKLETVERLLFMLNKGILPRVYEQGSLGASGDLAPLAHLCLPLIGEGDVKFRGKIMPASEALAEFNLQPLVLSAKEGLALLNGTQFMLAFGIWCWLKGNHIMNRADMAAALSIDGFDAKPEPYNDLIHRVRPHAGQRATAARMLELLEGSEITFREKQQVQDPYSFRCIPQVHGASRDAMAHVKQTLEVELNSVSDNPNVFPDEDMILSGGNFHGQPLALAIDYMSMALAEIASISERRIFLLLSGSRGLPLFLSNNPGLHSGLMIAQYLAAALVSQNKQLAVPAVTDTIPSSNGQEDHVSMGANSATKCYRIIHNIARVIGVEWISASQALHFREPLKTAPGLLSELGLFRQVVPFIDQDRILHYDITAAETWILSDCHSA